MPFACFYWLEQQFSNSTKREIGEWTLLSLNLLLFVGEDKWPQILHFLRNEQSSVLWSCSDLLWWGGILGITACLPPPSCEKEGSPKQQGADSSILPTNWTSYSAPLRYKTNLFWMITGLKLSKYCSCTTIYKIQSFVWERHNLLAVTQIPRKAACQCYNVVSVHLL